ncbi:MAG TPA: DUF1553 domain-containing protein, partial [Isosphaeraceae bacterium]|nr:DUF1553 domain-containing protein [Isosphaeraceae bacterium]
TLAAVREIESEFLSRHEPARSGSTHSPDLDELRYRLYRDTWDRLPDFGALKAESTGDLPSGLFDIAPRTRDEAIGFVFEGMLIVPSQGAYTFYLDSDDGSRLVVADQKVLEYDGIHSVGQERAAQVDLPKGRVPIRLEYFQRYAEFGLSVAWSGPGFKRRSLSVARAEKDARNLARLIESEGARVLGLERFKEYHNLKRALRDLKKEQVPFETALRVTEAGTEAPETYVLLRGNPRVKGAKVEPGFPRVLCEQPPDLPGPSPGSHTTMRRLALANWIASEGNPLSARVIVNRLWQHHFGRGLVRSPNNFGLQGDPCTNPALLDWLASELVRQGWQLKPLHRLIMTSNAYRMSSRANAEGLAKDPANDLFWRFDMRRLSAEEIRDSILAASGALNSKMYGPGIYPEIAPEVLAGQSMPGKGWNTSPPHEASRRSAYIHIKRSLLMPILESFDMAETDRSAPSRFSTTQPTQALALLNGRFLNQQAAAFAERLTRDAAEDPRAIVRLALRIAAAREPTSAEVERGVTLMRSLEERDGQSARDARQAFCLV